MMSHEPTQQRALPRQTSGSPEQEAPDRMNQLVAKYWGRQTPYPVKLRVRNAISSAGLDPDRLCRSDIDTLADVDEVHCMRKAATVELARLSGLAPGTRVLDVGCGIGGPARRLALEYGCSVVGLDITKEFVETARAISDAMRLSKRNVEFHHGDAVCMPFEDGAFEFVWSQVATTNIGARDRLYAEIHRLLKPGGRAAMFDIFAGPGGPVHFPVPWG